MPTQLPLPFGERPRTPRANSRPDPAREVVVIGRREWMVTYVRHRRARHYVLRVEDEGSLRVTIPRGGSRKEAERFAKQKAGWIDRERFRRAMIRGNSGAWGDGATTTVHAIATVGLRRLAERELPARLMEMAASLGHQVSRVTIRDQRSRWGSCSPSGRISLNWRLIQVPPSVRDYVLLHELTHLVESNHSPRFWKKLEAVCPWHREARTWLRARPLVP